MEPVRIAPRPGPRDAEVVRVGEAFEALVIERVLKGARVEGISGALSGTDSWADLADRHRAELLATGSPLGVARLIAEAVAREAGDE